MSFDNLYDYLGCDPIFDELNAFGRANKARLEATAVPMHCLTGDLNPDFPNEDDDRYEVFPSHDDEEDVI